MNGGHRGLEGNKELMKNEKYGAEDNGYVVEDKDWCLRKMDSWVEMEQMDYVIGLQFNGYCE